MPYKDPEKQREFQRVWVAARRREYFDGKACVQCGSTDQLELDHVDPAVKVSHRIWSWADGRRHTELAKCQPLCFSCHKGKTNAAIRQAPRDTRGRFLTQ
ncbi:HNH endonuclease [Streptomyces griseofuscus]|uniref:HNH endonuclease n=1 Tax=Streptomyces griseofuscus TaxID=146922 RepID=UPI00340B2BFE